ncbi:uncharacterized protein LOC128962461 [Oppia nitens]|uniref:uncharacterized protein LOC128962461 n=1 Tax=Oppia nitens TaxID=1686743 RepID=UPI0023DBAD89|nr:uncharacterized protein LOC128962461 [Oppia nitens]
MSFKLKDDYKESKSELIFLDLSETIILTKEDLDKTISRIPNLKLRSDPIDDIIDKRFNDLQTIQLSGHSKCLPKNIDSNSTRRQTLLVDFNTTKLLPKFSFKNPIPESMSGLNLNDFCETDIDWKMLTILRPETHLEEQYFTNLVQLYQLRHKTRCELGFVTKETIFKVSRHPRVMQYKPFNFKRFDSFGFKSIIDKIQEDFTYNAFARVPIEPQSTTPLDDMISDPEIQSFIEKLDLKL